MKLTIQLASLLFVLLSADSSPAKPQESLELSAPLTFQPPQRVGRFEVSADQRWIAFDAETLRTLRLDPSGTLVELSVAPWLVTASFFFSPDGARVLWTASQAGSVVRVLFSACPDGTGAVRLSPELGSNGNVDFSTVAVSPDGQTALYRTTDDRTWAVPIDGSTQAVHLPMVPPFGSPLLTHDGTGVLFRAPLNQPGVQELFLTPTDGSATVQVVSGPLVSGGDVNAHWITPDGNQILYAADEFVNNRVELFRLPSDLSTPPQVVNHPLVGPESVVAAVTAFDPTSTWVAYHTTPGGGGRYLHTARLDGTTPPVEQYAPPNALANSPATFTANGSRVLFEDSSASANGGVYSAPSDGSSVAVQVLPGSTGVLWQVAAGKVLRRSGDQVFAAPLNGSMPPEVIVDASLEGLRGFELTPLGYGLVYATDQGALHGVPLFGPPTSFPLVTSTVAPWATRYLNELALSDRAAFWLSDEEQYGAREIFAVPLDASQAETVAHPPLLGPPITTSVTGHRVSPDGQWVVYTDGRQIFGAPFGEPDQAQVISPPDFTFFTGDFVITPDSRHAFASFGLDQDALLWRLRIDGSEAPVLVVHAGPGNSLGAAAHQFGGFRFTPDGGTLVCDSIIRTFNGSTTRVYALAVDLSSPPLLLASTGQSFGAGDSYEVRALLDAGQRVLLAGSANLGTVPIDGSAAPTNLLPAGAFLLASELTADGGRVVYAIDDAGSDQLWSAPLDGSAAPTLIEPALSVTPGSPTLALDPVGNRVAYRRIAAGGLELRVLDLDVPPPATLLATHAAGTRLQDFQFGPGGARLAFLADTTALLQYDLYLAPTDGSTPAAHVHGPATGGGSVDRIERSGEQLVFRAPGLDPFALRALWSVPFAGGSPRLLHEPMPGSGVEPDFTPFRGGRHVLFRGTRDGHRSLWLGRVDRPLPERRLSGPYAGHPTEVATYRLTPGGSHVSYTADLDSDGVFELYARPLTKEGRENSPGF